MEPPVSPSQRIERVLLRALKIIVAAFATVLGIPLLLLIGGCMLNEVSYRHRARELAMELRRVPLPQSCTVIEEGIRVGNYTSGTGNGVDAVAYRVFTTNIPAEEVLSARLDFGEIAKDEWPYGVFMLDGEAKEMSLTEFMLKDELKTKVRPAYVIFAAERVGDELF